MASLNRVTLIGHLGADPEVRYTQNREAIATIRIATTETYKDKSSGERKETTEWHRIVFFNRMAEVAGEYLKKGSPIYVEGRIQTRKWQDKEGHLLEKSLHDLFDLRVSAATRADILEWMLSPKDRSNAFSYLACCRLFGINPEEIQERVLERYRQRHTH